MKLGIFAKTFAGDTPLAVLAAARDAGFAAVQYNMACSGIGALPQVIAPQVAQAVAKASAATGVEIAAVSATYNMTHPDPVTRAAGRASFAAIAAAAGAMGTRLVTVCTGSLDAADQWRHHPDNASPAAWRLMLDEFAALLDLAERHDILIGVEPELANVVSNAARAQDLLTALPSPRIGIILDPANLFETASDPGAIIDAAVALLGPRIVMAHAKDRHADGSFAAAGQGVIDFDRFVAALAGVGFAGPMVTHGLTAEQAPGVAKFLAARGRL